MQATITVELPVETGGDPRSGDAKGGGTLGQTTPWKDEAPQTYKALLAQLILGKLTWKDCKHSSNQQIPPYSLLRIQLFFGLWKLGQEIYYAPCLLHPSSDILPNRVKKGENYDDFC